MKIKKRKVLNGDGRYTKNKYLCPHCGEDFLATYKKTLCPYCDMVFTQEDMIKI